MNTSAATLASDMPSTSTNPVEVTNIIQLLEFMFNTQQHTVAPVAPRKLKVTLVVDVSGSTNTEFRSGMTVLEKEADLARAYILDNPENEYELYTFDTDPQYYGTVNFLSDEKIVDFPNLVAGSCTWTHKPLDKIVQNLHKFKPDIVIVYTDGATFSIAADFTPATTAFKANGIALHFVAVSPLNQNMEDIIDHMLTT